MKPPISILRNVNFLNFCIKFTNLRQYYGWKYINDDYKNKNG